MNRIATIETATANAEQKALLDAIQGQLGMVPNFLKVFANSPVALRAFLGLHGVANGGSLDALTRERIALALAQQNSCEYCLSAHTAIGRKTGLNTEEMNAARSGNSTDAQADVAVKFAQSLMENKGAVSAIELAAIRSAGYSESDIVEIITHVGMNFLTNILAKASHVEIDFPKVELKIAA
ncbi:carboxymuconolactone decarboxylase family protein [Duganella violaceipulchra]|uniref:Carboxymuconolactone decarboxylase family protein n=1 Tax=Duganella violaceipulchra TaxID=2849652 RepID=A0AA41HF80_9BURK|nr:carboxymuconolactone decarboxylase family protein [Duganella violaceicalia]MBV6323867.1 carboxymuconolactone decarboxylase family protein [Duganella violaceicalia]MCP2007559.1 putative peroxidase-related enzyme [Duganella violaceicalia]